MTREPQLTCVFTVRAEPDWFVADMMANAAPWIDHFVCVTVPDEGPWLHEGEMLERKRRAVWDEVGPGWTLWLDPDERLEDRAALEHIRPAIARPALGPNTLFGFPLREMWTSTAYRIDGAWRNKLPRHRLFYLASEGRQAFRDRPIHCPAAPTGSKRYRWTLPVDLYHLKNIEPANRAERAKAYTDADPGFRHQRPHDPARPSWDWLADETGLRLREIPPGRAFTPPYASPYQFVAPA